MKKITYTKIASFARYGNFLLKITLSSIQSICGISLKNYLCVNYKKIILLILLVPIFSYAQTGGYFSLSDELGIEIIPTYPEPNSFVEINLSLYTADIKSAEILWYRNGKLELKGRGETSFGFTTGETGKETVIEIVINLLNSVSFSRKIVLSPAYVDLAFEADSYIPPFYRGKALNSQQGRLKVVATPEFIKEGKRIDPKNLLYQWSNGNEVYEKQSGYGKNVVVFDGSILGRMEEVSLLVRDPITNMVAQSFLDISPVKPEIIFYENSPYYGHIFEKSLGNFFDLKDKGEIQIAVAPYYVSKEKNGFLTYEWKLNGTLSEDLLNSRTAIFKKPEGESGQSRISVAVKNSNRILQFTESNITLRFQKEDE